MRKGQSRFLIGAYVLVSVAGLLAVVGLRGAVAGVTIHVKYMHVHEDRIRNWDYHDVNTNNDMPVDLFFTNGATIAAVNRDFKPLFPDKIQPGHLLTIPDWLYSQVKSPAKSAGYDNETNGRNDVITREHHYIDSDRGMKDYACGRNDGNGLTHHVRVYAPKELDDGAYTGFQSDSLYTRRFGYYVYATSHEDHNEKACNQWGKTHGTTWFGASERVERWLAEEFDRGKLPQVAGMEPDAIWMNNKIGWPWGAWDGNHYYENDGWATRFRLHAGATASSAGPVQRVNQYAGAALTRFYNYQNGGGSGDHWTTTGPADSEHDVVEGTLGFLENTQVSGTAPLYECERNGWEHFLSRDVSCAPGDLEGLAGYIYISQSSLASTPLLSCKIGEEIFESTSCEGYPTRGTLGYLKGSGQLRRYVGGTVDHDVTTGPGPAGSTLEGTALGQLVQGYAENRHPLYSCRVKSNPRDHFLSKDRGCEGQELLALEGYAYDSPPTGTPTTQIYRCWYPGGHFVSNQSSCEGYTMEFSLGYTYSP